MLTSFRQLAHSDVLFSFLILTHPFNAASRSQIATSGNMTGWWNHSVLRMKKTLSTGAWKDGCERFLKRKLSGPVLMQCAPDHFPMARCTLHASIYPGYNIVFLGRLGGINIKWHCFRDLNNTGAMHGQRGKILNSHGLYIKIQNDSLPWISLQSTVLKGFAIPRSFLLHVMFSEFRHWSHLLHNIPVRNPNIPSPVF